MDPLWRTDSANMFVTQLSACLQAVSGQFWESEPKQQCSNSCRIWRPFRSSKPSSRPSCRTVSYFNVSSACSIKLGTTHRYPGRSLSIRRRLIRSALPKASKCSSKPSSRQTWSARRRLFGLKTSLLKRSIWCWTRSARTPWIKNASNRQPSRCTSKKRQKSKKSGRARSSPRPRNTDYCKFQSFWLYNLELSKYLSFP